MKSKHSVRCLRRSTSICNFVITSASVLVYFDNSKETALSVDASNISLVAVIMQEHRPDAFSLKNCLGEDVR